MILRSFNDAIKVNIDKTHDVVKGNGNVWTGTSDPRSKFTVADLPTSPPDGSGLAGNCYTSKGGWCILPALAQTCLQRRPFPIFCPFLELPIPICYNLRRIPPFYIVRQTIWSANDPETLYLSARHPQVGHATKNTLLQIKYGNTDFRYE